MKALAKVYPLLGSIRFLALLLAVLALSFAAHLWIKSVPKSSVQLTFTVGHINHTLPFSESLDIHPFDVDGQHCEAVAVKAVYISDVIADLVERNRIQKVPLLGFVQDAQSKEYIVLINGDRELTVSSVDWLLKNTSRPREAGIEVKFPNEHSSLHFKIWSSAN